MPCCVPPSLAFGRVHGFYPPRSLMPFCVPLLWHAVGQISIRELRRKFIDIAIPPAIGKNTEHVATMGAILEWAGEPVTPFLDYLLLRLVR